jgi:hypothetical protein
MTNPQVTPEMEAAWTRNTMHYFAQKTYVYTLKNQRGGFRNGEFLADNDDAAYDHIKAVAEYENSTIHTWKQV